MEGTVINKPIIKISYDEMEAYLTLPLPLLDQRYDLTQVLAAIEERGVRSGVNVERVAQIINENIFERECLIAKGVEVVHGTDAYFDYHFNTDFNKKPSTRSDGSVDYWSIHSIEIVDAGQVIATYHEPVEGKDGITVTGKTLIAKKGRPLPPLTGKGFERSEDNITYTSMIQGKIEMQRNRIMISTVHEVQGDVGLKTGNIDFRGDVIVHGNVPTGAVIKATGTVTIDGTVEGCIIEANKDVIIRGGMLGKGKGRITTKGSLYVKFLEYATVKAEGKIETDSAVDCQIICNDKVYMKGKRASIIGGVVNAAKGIEAVNFGNAYGVKTEVYAGVNMEVKREICYLEKNIEEAEDVMEKINVGLKQLDDVAKEKNLDLSKDPRRASLLRTKIIKQADISAYKQQLFQMRDLVESAHGAAIKAIRDVHPGVIVGINDSVITVQEIQQSVAFCERDSNVVMYSLKGEVVV